MVQPISIKPPYKVLVVDDDEDIAEAVQDTVDRLYAGMVETSFITSPEEALSLIKENPLDILITDLRMPGMFGDSLIYEAKKVNPGLFCIICTGCPSLTTAMAARAHGVHGFIEKPFNDQVIQEALEPFIRILELWHEAIKKQVAA